MANYLVAGTNHNLDDYFYLLTYPSTNTQGQTQLTSFKQNGADLNTKYLPHALANNNTDTDPTGFRYKQIGTNTMTDLNKLFAMKITPTITGTHTSSFINNTRQITFRGNGTITFSNASDNPFRATVIVIGGGGGGANGSRRRTGQGGGGGAIAFGIITLAVGVTYTATVPGPAGAEINGSNTSFVGANGSSIIANGGNAGIGENNGGESTNTISVSANWASSVTGYFGGAGGGAEGIIGVQYKNGTNADAQNYEFNNGVQMLNHTSFCGGGGSGTTARGGNAGLNGIGGGAGSSVNVNGTSALLTSYGSGGGGGDEGSDIIDTPGGLGGSGGPGAVIILY
jgi:hypothetical protein